ncbi:MAG: trans-2-enoyl-CoA reductase [Verrucomicrobia bacterium GWC2_42_7]|nr:MAG: trans-2-enoyl-CoA reductase [Verrucomicrobia bacterium GWC2_42_7]
MIIKPKIRGFICITAHPEGCNAHVQQQIDYVKKQKPIGNGPKKVLVLGASTGYGLASRIAAAFGSKAATLGVFFERPEEAPDRPASAGWYNSVAFEKAAAKEGLYAKSINGDAFSNEVKQQVIDTIKKDLGTVDLVVYSLASPRRMDPKTGQTFKSCLKPIGQTFTSRTLDTDKGVVQNVTIGPASEDDIFATTKVMGGEDWEWWMDALHEAKVLAHGTNSVAYSYIGPEITWPVYTNGTIGKAKEHLEHSAEKINALLKLYRGKAFVSVNKAVVTQASSAIPVVPLYISILFNIMKEKGLHEDCIEQMYRLFADNMYNGSYLNFDEKGRVRLDDWEMKPEIQEAVKKVWDSINTENLKSLADFDGYQKDFLKLFGFGIESVDYERDVSITL